MPRRPGRSSATGAWPAGFTLVELLVGATFLTMAIVALMGAFVAQLSVNEHSRYQAFANNDASRVMEQLRRENSGGTCDAPSANPPPGFASWDVWLADMGVSGGGGKSIQSNPATNELVVVTPVGTNNPLEITVAVCWRHRERTWGECTWNGTALAADPGAGDDPVVTESPAMLSTVMTCRRG